MVYPALLPLMRTTQLPVVDWTDAPADLNGLVRFAERRNLVSARAPSHFKRSLTPHELVFVRMQGVQKKILPPIPKIELTYLVSNKLYSPALSTRL